MRTVLIALLALLLLGGAVGLIVRITRQEDGPSPDLPVLSEKLELDKTGLIF